jgi:hypothetical protein
MRRDDVVTRLEGERDMDDVGIDIVHPKAKKTRFEGRLHARIAAVTFFNAAVGTSVFARGSASRRNVDGRSAIISDTLAPDCLVANLTGRRCAVDFSSHTLTESVRT